MSTCLRAVLLLFVWLSRVGNEVGAEEGSQHSGSTIAAGVCARDRLAERRRDKKMDVQEEKPVILALPGPLFPPIDFDSPGAEQVQSQNSGLIKKRFAILGTNLYLKKEPRVDSSDHAEQTAGSIWDCSLVLAKYLEKHSQKYLRGNHVLELGSGQGVVGIACGLAGAQRVTVTDVNAALPFLHDNAALNKLEDVVKVKELDWLRAEEHVKHLEPADLIVAADVVWIDQLVRPFVKALTLSFEASKAALKQVHVILCHKTRSHHTDNLLFDLLREAKFSWKEDVVENCHEEYRSSEIRIFHLFHEETE